MCIHVTKQTRAFRNKNQSDTGIFTCSNRPCYQSWSYTTPGCRQAARAYWCHKIATGIYKKMLVSISLSCSSLTPRCGALSLRMDIGYEYMKYEAAGKKGLVPQLAVGIATNDVLA